MPQVDSDIAAVISVSRQGTNQAPTNITVNLKWIDGVTQEDKGTYGSSWANLQELNEFLGGQGYDDVLRAIASQWVNRATGAFRPAQFDAMSGKTYEIQVRVREVVA